MGKAKPQKPATGPGRNIIKLATTTAGKNAITAVAEQYGMKEQAVAGRIYDWFFRQDDVLQRAVLGFLDGLEVDAAAMFMERFARQKADAPFAVEGEPGGSAKGGPGSSHESAPQPASTPPSRPE